MPTYKLMYFDARGRAEVARLLFAQAGVEYEDCRLSGEEFGAIKGDAVSKYKYYIHGKIILIFLILNKLLRKNPVG